MRLYEHIVRFSPAGTFTWIVPPGCFEVDVFLVGGGGSGGAATALQSGTHNYAQGGGGGGGYTATFLGVAVTPGQSIQIVVGAGGARKLEGTLGVASQGNPGGYSQFLNSTYRANGGLGGKNSNTMYTSAGGNGGSGGGGESPSSTIVNSDGGSDGSNGIGGLYPGQGQGYNTRDFGEPSGKRNAGGGAGGWWGTGVQRVVGGISDYTAGSGSREGHQHPDSIGGGYGGGGAGGVHMTHVGSLAGIGGAGGYGTVLLRFKSTAA